MFCSKCGAKVKKDDEFCKKCGHPVSSRKGGEESKEDEKSSEHSKNKEPDRKESEKETPAKKTNSASVCCGVLLILVAIPLIISVGGYTNFAKSGASTNAFSKVMTLFLIILAVALGAWLIVVLIKSFIKKPLKTAIVLGASLVVAGVIAFFGYSYSKTNAADNFNTIQNSLTDVLVAQSLGDDIIAGKSDAKFTSVHDKTQKAVDNLSKIKPPASLKYYYNAVNDWAKDINSSAKTKASWAKRPDAPGGLQNALSKSVAKSLFWEALNKITLEKDYGDWAIATGDKDTMRYVFATIRSQDIFISNVKLSDANPPNDSVAGFISIAYAKSSLRFPRGRCREFTGCGDNVRKKLPPVYQSARNYAVGEPDAAKQWQDGWSDLLNTIKIDNGYNVGGAGVSQGDKATPPVSPMQQAFNDECRAKGGTPGGTGGVKDRLPTTLSSGYNCDYKPNGHTCWDYLTTTGERFMGGENGCPEQGLLPKIAPAPKNNTPQPTKTSAPTFDGTYHVAYSAAHCNVGVSTGYSSIFDAAGVSDTIIVSGNRVHNFDGSTSAIDSGGHASFTYSFNYASAGNVAITQTFNFSGSSVSGEASFKANASTEGVSGEVTCSESFSGSK